MQLHSSSQVGARDSDCTSGTHEVRVGRGQQPHPRDAAGTLRASQGLEGTPWTGNKSGVVRTSRVGHFCIQRVQYSATLDSCVCWAMHSVTHTCM